MPFTCISLIRAQRVYAKGCSVQLRAYLCLFVPNRLPRHRNECEKLRKNLHWIKIQEFVHFCDSRTRFLPNSVVAKTRTVLLWLLQTPAWLTRFCCSHKFNTNTQADQRPWTHWNECQILTKFCSDQYYSGYTCVLYRPRPGLRSSVVIRSLTRQQLRVKVEGLRAFCDTLQCSLFYVSKFLFS